MPAVCPRRILVALALCGALFAFHARAMAQSSGQTTTDQSVSGQLDDIRKTMNDIKAKQQKEEEDKAAEEPSFTFQWLSYAGARVTATTKSKHTYKAEIWEVGGGPSEFIQSLDDEAAVRDAREDLKEAYLTGSKGANYNKYLPQPLWAGRLVSTPDGYSTSLAPLGDYKDDLNRVLRQNGWVTIYYVEDPQTTVRQVTVNVIERNVLALHAGMGFTLDPSGSWQTKPEFALAATSRWKPWFSGFVDMRYAYNAPKGSSETDSSQKPNMAAKAEDNGDTNNPLKGVNGTFRANFYGEVLPWSTPSFGFIAGAGIATESDTERVIAPLRVFAGIRFEVFAYNTLKSEDFFGKASGFFQAGYARDPWWEFDQTIKNADGTITTVHHNDQNRLWFEGQVNFNDSKKNTVVYAARVYGDVPTKGKGNSDIRVSVLASIQIQRLLGFASVGGGS